MQDASFADRSVALLDFDGTLVNTGPVVIKCCRATLRARGFSDEEMGDLSRFIGPPLVAAFRDFYHFPEEEALACVSEYRAIFDTFSPDEYPLFDGVRDLVQSLRARGWRLAIATSRLEERAVMMARELGLGSIEVVKGLREPDRLTKADSIRDALRELGAAATDAVMVGDRSNDVVGAHAMGVPCVGIRYSGTSREELEGAGADAICDTIDDLRRVLGVADV